MNTEIINAAVSYCTERSKFNAKYGKTLHKDYLDMLFLGASTRPELAEYVPLVVLGYTPLPDKHGYDGDNNGRPVEGKIRTTDTQRLQESSQAGGQFTSITVNDPSDNIVKKYDRDNPEFVFAFFIDGHLLVAFSIEWKNLREHYVRGIENIKRAGNGRRNFSLTVGKWLPHATVVYKHSDPAVLALMPHRKIREIILGTSG